MAGDPIKPVVNIRPVGRRSISWKPDVSLDYRPIGANAPVGAFIRGEIFWMMRRRIDK